MTYKLLWGMEILILLGITMLILYGLFRLPEKNRAIGIGLSALLLIAIFYNVYDNNRFVVQQQIIYIENLPPAFEGFTILQISDLHGKIFGQNQVNLTSRINAIDHDMIAFTGDMEDASKSFQPFITLLDGIEDKTNILYVNGDEDLAYKFLSGVPTETGQELEAHGCILFTKPYPLERDGVTLWLINDLTKNFDKDFDVYQDATIADFKSHRQSKAYGDYFAELNAISAQIKQAGDPTIAIMHIPYTRSDLENMHNRTNILDYDLIIAGHYHGGLLRVPCYGAIYVPDYSTLKSGWFPDQKYVSGLVAYNGIQQYVSRGLGSSTMIPFRLFNTPEINLLVLRAK